MDRPRFVLSRSRALEGYSRLRGLCPDISYSLKTNPEVGRLLEEDTGCTFGVHTAEGLRDVRDPSRVHFLVQANTRESLSGLLKEGVRSFIVDNEADLGNLLGVLGRDKADIFLRMRFQETTIYKGRFFLYGMLPETINRLVPELRGNPGVGRLGIHFHRKTQNTGNWSLRYMLEEALTEGSLDSIDMVNIGGGIPVDYKNSRADNLDYIFGKIRELRHWLESRGIGMIMEPGRAIAAPAVRLETGIASLHGRNITVNASVYNSSMDTIIFPLKLLVEGEGEGKSYLVKGCTPDSMDIFRYDVRLRSPRLGGTLTFLNAGAYNFSSSFCNLERPETVVVD